MKQRAENSQQSEQDQGERQMIGASRRRGQGDRGQAGVLLLRFQACQVRHLLVHHRVVPLHTFM